VNSEYPGPDGSVLVSPYKGMINISFQVAGRLEYWNIEPKIGMFPIWEYQNAHVSYKVGGSPQPVIPLFHYSRQIIYWKSQLFLTYS
jgi:hypothetical protein